MRTFGPVAVAFSLSCGAVLTMLGASAVSSAPDSPALIRVPLSLDGLPAAAMTSRAGMTVVGQAAQARHRVAFHQGQFLVGVADYTPMELELKDYPNDEFMYFLEGSVDITDARGVTQHVQAGDAIVMPKGFNGRWKQRGPVRKIAVMNVEAAPPEPAK